jgi:large-conductance mechanosensitive channel
MGGLSEVQKFIVDNNIVGTSVGVCVGLAAKDLIQSIVGNIIIPALLIPLQKFNINFVKKYLPSNAKNSLDVASFIKQAVTFALVILTSFIFVKVVFGYLLKVHDVKPGRLGSTSGSISGNKNDNPIITQTNHN